MCVQISEEQRRLEEQHAGGPDRGAAAETRQQHLGEHGLYEEEQLEATKVVPANSQADGAERVGGRLTDSARAGVGRSDWREICNLAE